MGHKPSFQFYPGDWLKDTALRICCPAARGIWADMLMLLHECPQRGVFRSKKGTKMTPISIKKISKSIASCKPKLIKELIDNGVVYIARKDGALYSKRLVRDELHRKHKAMSGQKGGSKTQANLKQKSEKRQANPGSSTSTSTSTSPSGKSLKFKKDYLLGILKKDHGVCFRWFLAKFETRTKRDRDTLENYAKICTAMIDRDQSFNYWLTEALEDIVGKKVGYPGANKMFIKALNTKIGKTNIN